MSEKENKKINSNAVPFFARYLEGQYCEDLSEEEMDRVHGGLSKREKISKRYPNDLKDIVTTMKYPSDHEDSSPKHPPIAMTKKYPSDADEAMTHKFPSDGDDELPPHYERW
ncbi:Serine endopeptidase inhibitor [Rivularia sp. PCC 7116]|uniref:microviridin/marinostatin family tricyclic proteinase inhibitor n=1 Tax=Rivularia sp. PCC 7116 TaxID=373994 RepID=UPI00029F4BE7|nr:microviridin/marinostatin family tricyclic proteinase inhibitor [Rivularia sp. PCC 7116]AFY55913.1 Serine endopeptidase inhibitor [Rivularia sp. PCC 7116]